MDQSGRIVADPRVMVGQPVVKGTRLTVEFILGLLAEGWTVQRILKPYPRLTKADALACVVYARDLVSEVRVYPLESPRTG
jgi:uncharacterized protein (DUF433 family)